MRELVSGVFTQDEIALVVVRRTNDQLAPIRTQTCRPVLPRPTPAVTLLGV